MSPIERSYFYVGSSSDVDKNLLLKMANGSSEESSRDLYFDERLTKKSRNLILTYNKN